MNQRGFATLEVILMVLVIGILASVAVPRFTDVTTKANTAKIQSDLTTIDTAIQIYYMEKGTYPSSLESDLKNYLMDIPTPPTGSAYVKASATATPAAKTIDSNTTAYTIINDQNAASGANPMPKRAALAIDGNNHVAGDFALPKS